MNNFSEIANFLWSVADLIRDVFRRGHYQDVILPLTVLRRIDCVLEPTKEDVLSTNNRLKGKLTTWTRNYAGRQDTPSTIHLSTPSSDYSRILLIWLIT